MEKLFDVFERTRIRKANASESLYKFLNESKWPWVIYYRSLIEEWYSEFPTDKSFYCQFTSKDDRQHQSAFFELFLFSLFRRSGLDVEYHRQVGNRKIDLAILCNPTLLIDCTLSGEPNTDPSIETIEHEIEDIIDSLNSPIYWVSVHFEMSSRKTPKLGNFKKALEKKLKNMNPLTCFKEKFEWRNGDWIIEVVFTKKQSEIEYNKATVVSSQGGGFIDGQSMTILRRTLDSKRGSLYKVGSPYVIAINSFNSMINNNIILGTLYGQKGIVDFNNNLSIENPFFNAQQNTSVSGMLLVKGLYSGNMGCVNMELWENPWAKHPIDIDLNIKRYSPQVDDKNMIKRIQVFEGRKTFDLLQIEENYHNYDL